MSNTKSCPHCGKEIKSGAKKCRFCGRWCDEPVSQGSQQNQLFTTSNNNMKYVVLGLLIVIAIGVAYIAFSKPGSQSSGGDTYTPSASTENDTIPAEYVEEPIEDDAPAEAEPEGDYSEFE